MDEKSLNGQRMLGHTFEAGNSYFNDGKHPENCGNLYLVGLLGDAGQLPPILDRPLSDPAGYGDMSRLGKWAYSMFDQTVFLLVQSKRQEGDKVYGEVLRKLREGKGDEACLQQLQKRVLLFLSEEENAKFKSPDTVHAFSTKADAAQFNLDYMSSFKTWLHRSRS